MAALCIRCNGRGTYLGNGMMQTTCELCDGGNKPYIEPPALDKLDRRSESYRKAIKDIMALNPEMSRTDAVKMFDEAYVKS